MLPYWSYTVIASLLLASRHTYYGTAFGSLRVKNQSINQMYLHQLMLQSAVQKPSLKPQTTSNAGVEAWWLGKTP